MNVQQQALTIWQAGVNAVEGSRLVQDAVAVRDGQLIVRDLSWDLAAIRRIVVVGGGKAVGEMVCGLAQSLQDVPNPIVGWLNVPAGSVAIKVQPLEGVTIHEARPVGINYPTPQAVAGTRKMLELVSQCEPNDLCLYLLSGGGSALISAPPTEVTLEDKCQLIDRLSSRGASIQQLNAVRRCVSDVKGGGLAQPCRAGQQVALIISDVLDSSLESIASGPTVVGSRNFEEARNVLESILEFDRIPSSIRQRLENGESERAATGPEVQHRILADNQTAVEAARQRAIELGFQVHVLPLVMPQPTAEAAGRELANYLNEPCIDEPQCWISGGEPIVHLVDDAGRGKGGRNQQLALAALESILEQPDTADFALVSGGTDGEDGPTDAAGAVVDRELVQRLRHSGKEVTPFLQSNDAYHFFEPLQSLLKTGWTGTNVCDLRVLVRLP